MTTNNNNMITLTEEQLQETIAKAIVHALSQQAPQATTTTPAQDLSKQVGEMLLSLTAQATEAFKNHDTKKGLELMAEHRRISREYGFYGSAKDLVNGTVTLAQGIADEAARRLDVMGNVTSGTLRGVGSTVAETVTSVGNTTVGVAAQTIGNVGTGAVSVVGTVIVGATNAASQLVDGLFNFVTGGISSKK